MRLHEQAFNLFTQPMHWHTYVYFFPVKLAAPAVVTVQVMSADSIKVSWAPAPTATGVIVTYNINASSPKYQAIRRNVTDPDREVVISGLHPFAEYYITVQAGNPGGLSEPTGRSANTPTTGGYLHSYDSVLLIHLPLNCVLSLHLQLRLPHL